MCQTISKTDLDTPEGARRESPQKRMARAENRGGPDPIQTASKPSIPGSPREPRLPLRFPARHSRFNRERAGLLDASPLAVKARRADIGVTNPPRPISISSRRRSRFAGTLRVERQTTKRPQSHRAGAVGDLPPHCAGSPGQPGAARLPASRAGGSGDGCAHCHNAADHPATTGHHPAKGRTKARTHADSAPPSGPVRRRNLPSQRRPSPPRRRQRRRKPAPAKPAPSPLPAPSPTPPSPNPSPKPAPSAAPAPVVPNPGPPKPAPPASVTRPTQLNLHKSKEEAPPGVPTLPLAPAAGSAGQPGSAAATGAPGQSRLNGLTPFSYGAMPSGGPGLRGIARGLRQRRCGGLEQR